MLGDVNVRQVFVRNKCSMFFFLLYSFSSSRSQRVDRTRVCGRHMHTHTCTIIDNDDDNVAVTNGDSGSIRDIYQNYVFITIYN